MRREEGLDQLSDEDFLREVQFLANCQQSCARSLSQRLHEICLIGANVITLFYCGDSITRRVLPDIDWVNALRMTILAVLAAGTVVANGFSKVPALADRAQGLKLNTKQRQLYHAIERGILQAQVWLHDNPNTPYALNVELNSTDFATFDDDQLTRSQYLLKATYDMPFTINAATAVDAETANTSNTTALTIAINQAATQRDGITLAHTTKHPCQQWRSNPGQALLQVGNSGVILSGFWLSNLLTVNQSAHEVLKAWTPLGADTHKAALATVLLLGVLIGMAKANTSHKIIGNMHQREVIRQQARCQLKLKPRINCRALWLSMPLHLIELVYCFNISIFFGAGGIDTLWEQLDWLSNQTLTGSSNLTDHTAPQGLRTACMAWFLLSNVGTLFTTVIMETYRKFDECGSQTVRKRNNDDSSKRFSCLYALAVAGIILDGINFAAVSANTADEAWSPLMTAGSTTPLTLAAIIALVQTVTTIFWSLSTFTPNFSGSMHTLTRCCGPRRSTSTSRATASLKTALIDSKENDGEHPPSQSPP